MKTSNITNALACSKITASRFFIFMLSWSISSAIYLNIETAVETDYQKDKNEVGIFRHAAILPSDNKKQK